MKKIRLWIRRYFGFSQTEVNGFIALIGVMVLLAVAPLLFDTFYKPAIQTDQARDQQLLDSLVAQLEARQPVKSKQPQFKAPSVPLRPFDPNTLTAEQWQQLGLPKYLAQRIINYRSKAGDFTYKAQLARIYGLPDSVYQQLSPYLLLPEERPSRYGKRSAAAATTPSPHQYESRRFAKEKFVLAPFNINTADTTQLKQIRGIGSKLSARIVKYRDGLGGFNNMAQLREVYGLQPEVVDSLQKYSYVQKAYVPQQINLNTATVDVLRAHPYISNNVARVIVAYREQHGPYQRVEDVQQVKLVTPELYEKLKPYLAL
ncbi:ComEA family DNA-binding protein [Botryobacter ruber]|uniref:ComEA family DNA-binding protein n=1 Tax=Botryobacter ruber TaxID=2171629 RepID=UPI000E0B997D|nr:helix-hairpin-helix domain-containing protein [Botryobacter ruber]